MSLLYHFLVWQMRVNVEGNYYQKYQTNGKKFVKGDTILHSLCSLRT